MWNDKRIVDSIRDGEDEGIIALYKHYREEFVRWADKTFSLDHELAADAFQEAILAVRYNIAMGKYRSESSLKTYLFTIGKHHIMRRQRKEQREIRQSSLPSGLPEIRPMYGSEESNERQMQIRNALQEITEPCKSIIKMFYYQGFSMDVIAERLNYKSAQVVKSQKVRCMDKLKKLALGPT